MIELARACSSDNLIGIYMKTISYREILRHALQSQRSNRGIALLLGISPHTVARCKRIAAEKNLDWPQVQIMNDRELFAVFNKQRSGSIGKAMPDWSAVYKLMQHKHQTLAQLWSEYKATHGNQAYGYAQFTYYYRKFLKKVDVSMRQVHIAGETVFVDYAGKTIPYYDETTGKKQQAQVFVAVLGCSNYTFAWASKSQSLEDWVEAHNRMFAFFEGVPETVVPDNLKSAVTKAGRSPQLNKTYQEMAEHYDCVILPARVRKPQDKSKAEIGVKLITQWISMPLSRRDFFSVAEINEAIAELLPVFNDRSFKRLPGSRRSRFEELDKPALKPLPPTPYTYAKWFSEQKVGSDYHIYVNGHAYSVPFRLVSERVSARMSANSVEIFHLGLRVATHARDDRQGESTTNPNHRPMKHQWYASQSLEDYTQWATSIGESAVEVVQLQFKDRADHALVSKKACSQLKALAKQYGEERLDKACARALLIHSPTVKSIRSILQHGLESMVDAPLLDNRIPTHPNVRGSSYYG